MKKMITLLSLTSCLPMIAGCNAQDAAQIAVNATQELGVPVILFASIDDECVNTQLRALANEYKHLHGNQKKALKEKFKRYDSIIIQSSEAVGFLDGVHKELRLINESCDPTGHCRNMTVAGKVLVDRKENSAGHQPATRIEMGRHLTITPQRAVTRQQTIVYGTYSRVYFDRMRPGMESDLDKAAADSLLENLGSKTSEASYCGEPLHFGSLF